MRIQEWMPSTGNMLTFAVANHPKGASMTNVAGQKKGGSITTMVP